MGNLFYVPIKLAHRTFFFPQIQCNVRVVFMSVFHSCEDNNDWVIWP